MLSAPAIKKDLSRIDITRSLAFWDGGQRAPYGAPALDALVNLTLPIPPARLPVCRRRFSVRPRAISGMAET